MLLLDEAKSSALLTFHYDIFGHSRYNLIWPQKSSVNSIDTRDLADVYLSSTFNEPSSVDISKAVKKYIIEGKLINWMNEWMNECNQISQC